MCGILGLVSMTPKRGKGVDERRFIAQGMVTGWLRGDNSTGYFAIKKGKLEPEMYKKALRGPDFMDLRVPEDTVGNLNKYLAFVGHHRAATRGNINHENAHPFAHGDIILVHNGTIDNDNVLPGVQTNRSDIEDVDSARLTYSLSQWEGDPGDFLARVSGGFALVWWDDAKKKLFITRNSYRPLNFAWNENKTSFYFASEHQHLRWLLDRNGIAINKDTVFIMPPYELAEFDISEDRIKTTIKSWRPADYFKYTAPASQARRQPPWQSYDQRLAQRQAEEEITPVRPAGMPTFPVFKTHNPPPQPEARLLHVEEMLATVGLDYNKECVVFPFNFVPINTSDGKDIGWAYFTRKKDGTVAEFAQIQVTKEQWEALTDFGDFCHFKCLALAKLTETGRPLVMGYVDWEPTRKHWALMWQIKNGRTDIKSSPLLHTPPVKGHVLGPPTNHRPLWIPQSSFIALVKGGCNNCTAEIPPEDHAEVVWLNSTTPLCKVCGWDPGYWASRPKDAPKALGPPPKSSSITT